MSEDTLVEKIAPSDEVPPPEDTAPEPTVEGHAAAPAAVVKQESIFDLVYASRDGYKLALAGAIDPDKFVRVAVTALRTTPKLQECNPYSVLGALMTSAQLALEPTGPLGQAYLVPFPNNKTGTIECQLIVGYQGLIELAYRSGRVMSVVARVVHEADRFSYSFGINDVLEHQPAEEEPVGPMTHVYAIGKLVGGGVIPYVMTKAQVDAVKASSPGAKKKGSPWDNHYEAMTMKTAVRRLFKWLPSSVESQRALGADGRVFTGVPASIEDIDEVSSDGQVVIDV